MSQHSHIRPEITDQALKLANEQIAFLEKEVKRLSALYNVAHLRYMAAEKELRERAKP